MKEIGNVFFAYLTDFIKIWLILWGIMNFTPVKKKSIYMVSFSGQCIFLIIAGILYKNYRDIVTISWTILIIVTICFIFTGNYFKKLAYSLLAYVLVLFLDICIVGISSIIADMSGHEFLSYSVVSIIYNAINIVTILVIVLIKKWKKIAAMQLYISKRIYAFLFAGAATGILILAALLVRSNNEATESARRAMVFVTIIVVVSYNAACLMMIIITESRDNYKALSIVSQNIIESQQQYYTLVNEKQQEMRGIRHEMKNHFACLYGLLKADRLREMEDYIGQLVEAPESSETLFDTGNDIVNAILNDAQSRFRKENINLRLEGGFPEDLKVSPMDLCVIFANTVSNAVEAIQRMKRNTTNDIFYVDIKISSFKDDLFIDIKNPCDREVVVHNGYFITSKKDKNWHGFGVKNVIQRVNKYQGSANFRNENDMFFVEIHMKNME